MRLTNELKTGIVIVAAICVMCIFFLKTTTVRTKTYEIKTAFTYGGDLKENATVKLTGIEAGRLKSMKFVYGDKTQVECVLEIDEDAKVRKDSIAYIGTAGFVGDAFIGITPGTSTEFIESGETIASEDPIQMRLLMKKADKIATNLNSTILQVKDLAKNLDGVVTDNEKGINHIIANLEDAAENFNEFSADVKSHPWKLMFKGEDKSEKKTRSKSKR